MLTETIIQVVTRYIEMVKLSRSQNTGRSYANAMRAYLVILRENGIDPDTALVNEITEDAILWLAAALKDYSPATEQLYLAAAAGFYEYLSAEKLAEINLPRLRLLIRQRSRRTGQRLPSFRGMRSSKSWLS